MESTVLYIKKYAMYDVSSLFRISKQKRGTHTILNLSIQLSFFSTHIFHIAHTFQENKEG